MGVSKRWIVRDRYGNNIYLSEERWEHIIDPENHSEMIDCEENLQQNPAPLFEVIDARLSSYWRFKVYSNGLLKLACEEWLSDRYFYDKLTDGEETEVLIFEKLKELIDAEALSPATKNNVIESVVLTANISRP